MNSVPGAVCAAPLPVALLCLVSLGTAAYGEVQLPVLADYEPMEIWELANLSDEDGVVRCAIGGEGLVEAPFSDTPCFMCRYRLTAESDASFFLWGDEAAGPFYILVEGKRFQLDMFTFEGGTDFGESHPLGEEPVVWRETWPDFSERTSDLESATWEEWRLEPGREYRFRVTELHGWYEGEIGHTIEWQLACLGTADEGETDD